MEFCVPPHLKHCIGLNCCGPSHNLRASPFRAQRKSSFNSQCKLADLCVLAPNLIGISVATSKCWCCEHKGPSRILWNANACSLEASGSRETGLGRDKGALSVYAKIRDNLAVLWNAFEICLTEHLDVRECC